MPHDWEKMNEQDCFDALYQTAGALRRLGNYPLATRVQKVADKLYPHEVKPLPLVPRTTHG